MGKVRLLWRESFAYAKMVKCIILDGAFIICHLEKGFESGLCRDN